MKIILTIGFCILANYVFALSETIDGITWSYYVKNGYAILEHPNTRKKETCPKPVHAGTLPPILNVALPYVPEVQAKGATGPIEKRRKGPTPMFYFIPPPTTN